MAYVITGGAGNISKPLVLQLLQAGKQVIVVGRNAANLKELTDAGATAAIGSVEDVEFLTRTFTGAEAVFTLVPPKWDAADWKGYIGTIGENFAKAIQAAGVKYVVNLSSIGAHLAEGAGPVSGLYRAEQALNTLTDVHIKHLRPAYFYPNLFANLGLIKQAGIIGGNYGGGSNSFALVAPADIAEVAAEELLNLSFTGHSVRYIASDEKTGSEIAAIIGAAIGKPELPWVEFTDEQSLQGAIGAGLSEEVAKNYTEMGHSLRTGIFSEDYVHNKPAVYGKTKLEDFAKVFAAVYHS